MNLRYAGSAAGFILAGGQSSRMGRDKALLEFAGRPLIAHAVAILSEAGLDATIAGAASSAHASLVTFAPIVADAAPGLGPLSGICSALATTSARHAVFLPIDLPLLPPSLLTYLLRHAQTTESIVTLPSVSGFAQTFPAVVDRVAFSVLQQELHSGRSGCFSAFCTACATLGRPLSNIPVEFLVQSGHISVMHSRPPIHWFLNLNSPDDLSRAEAICQRQ